MATKEIDRVVVAALSGSVGWHWLLATGVQEAQDAIV